MTDNIPVHMRITGLVPSNEDVSSRRSATAELATAWGKIKDVDKIVSKAAFIASSLGGDGTPVASLGMEVQAAVQNHASAFLYTERPLDVGVVAGMAAISMMSVEPASSGWTILDVYSNALWSALVFQPVLSDEKRENLRREVLDLAQQRSIRSAENARERDVVPDPVELTVTIDEASKAATNFKKAALNSIEALRKNAALDREELDFMWWSQLARSRLLGRSLSAIDEPLRLIASGIEASTHLRRLPAEVHRDLVLRTVDADPELDLAEVVVAVGDDRALLSAALYSTNVAAHPTVFPLLNAVISGASAGDGAEIKRNASIWGSRALLEGALSRMMVTGALKQ